MQRKYCIVFEEFHMHFPSYKHYMCNVHVEITQGTLISLYFTRIITFQGGLQFLNERNGPWATGKCASTSKQLVIICITSNLGISQEYSAAHTLGEESSNELFTGKVDRNVGESSITVNFELDLDWARKGLTLQGLQHQVDPKRIVL